MNALQRRHFLGLVEQQAYSRESIEQELALVLMCSYFLGLSLESVFELEFKNFELSDNQGFFRKPLNFESEHEEFVIPSNEAKSFYYPCAEDLRLCLPPILVGLLSGLPRMKSCLTFEDSISHTRQSILNLAKKKLKRVRKDNAPHLKLSQLPIALEAETSLTFDHPVISYHFCNQKPRTERSPVSRHYAQLKARDLENYWQEVQIKLGDGRPTLVGVAPQERNLGLRDGYILKPGCLHSFVNSLKTSVCKPTRPTLESAIEFHNQYTMYCLSFLIWQSCIRPGNDTFCNQDLIQPNLGLTQIIDKAQYNETRDRLVPLTEGSVEILRNYEQHLKGLGAFAKRNESRDTNFQDLYRYTTRLLNNPVRDKHAVKYPYRYFFRLELVSRGKKRTARKLIAVRSIKSNDITKHWKFHGFLGKTNYARRHYATLISDKYPKRHMVTELLLGHHDTTDLLSRTSIEMGSWLEFIDEFIEEDMQTLGWIPLKGFSIRNNKHALNITPNFPRPSVYPRSNVEHKRKEARKRRDDREVLTIIHRDINPILATLASKDRLDIVDEGQIRTLVELAGNPHSNSWNQISFPKGLRLDQTVQARNLFTQRRKTSHPNPISSNFLESVLELDRIARKFVSEVLNTVNTKTCLPETIAAMTIISASVLGRLCCVDSLKCITSSFSCELYTVSNTPFIEFSSIREINIDDATKHKSKKKFLFRRWQADPVTAALKFRLEGLPKNSWSAEDIERELSRLLGLMGAQKSEKSQYAFLAKLPQATVRLSLPAYQASILCGNAASVPLSRSSFVRLATDNILLESVETNTVPQKSLRRGKDNETTLNEFEQRIFKPELDALIAKYPTSSVVNCKKLGVWFNSLGERFPDYSLVFHYFLEWCEDMCLNGSMGMGYSDRGYFPYAQRTIKSYAGYVLNAIIFGLGKSNVHQMGNDDFDNFYSDYVENFKNLSTRSSVSRQIVRFHNFMSTQHGIKESSWVNERVGTIVTERPRSSEIVTYADYQSTLALISGQTNKPSLMKAQEIFLLIMMYRFGLRSGEVFRLQPRDISIDESSDQTFITIRDTVQGSTKSKSGRRDITLDSELTELEKTIIRQILSRSKELSGILKQNNLLADSITGTIVKNKAATLNKVAQALKHATGNPKIRPHHCRHAFASLRFRRRNNNKVEDWNFLAQRWTKEAQNLKLHDLNSGLFFPVHLATKLGHGHPQTSLKWYTHIEDSITCFDDENIAGVKDSQISALLGVRTNTYRNRRFRKHAGSHIAHTHPHLGVGQEIERHCSLNQLDLRIVPRFAINLPEYNLQNSSTHISSLAQFMVLNSISKEDPWQLSEYLYLDQHHGAHANRFATKNGRKHCENLLFPERHQQSTSHLTAKKRVLEWFSDNESRLNTMLTNSKEKKTIKHQLNIWSTCSQEGTLNVVVNQSSENEILSLVRKLGFEIITITRRSSSVRVARKLGIQHYSRSATFGSNSPHDRYELLLTYEQEGIDPRVTSMILFILLTLTQ